MTVADKLCVEQRRAPFLPGRRRRRGPCTHHPACFGRGRDGRRCNPQQKTGNASILRGQRQLAAGHEIKLSRLAPDFQHDRAHGIAGERVGGGAQGVLDIGGTHRHQTTWIKAEFGQSVHRQRADLGFRKILPHPDQWPPRRHPCSEARDKSRRHSALPAAFAKHLMHRAFGEPALQHRIGARMAERGPLQRMGAALHLDAFDGAAQSRKRACACACHGVASFTRGVAATSSHRKENQELAHSFMICSNIKLTTPAESIGIARSNFRQESQWDLNGIWEHAQPARIGPLRRPSASGDRHDRLTPVKHQPFRPA